MDTELNKKNKDWTNYHLNHFLENIRAEKATIMNAPEISESSESYTYYKSRYYYYFHLFRHD